MEHVALRVYVPWTCSPECYADDVQMSVNMNEEKSIGHVSTLPIELTDVLDFLGFVVDI